MANSHYFLHHGNLCLNLFHYLTLISIYFIGLIFEFDICIHFPFSQFLMYLKRTFSIFVICSLTVARDVASEVFLLMPFRFLQRSEYQF